MCGRYASSRKPEDLVEEFEVDSVATKTLEPSFNVAPTDTVYAVLERRRRNDPDPGAPTTRRLTSAVWGLVPSWAKDRSIGSRLINARVETLAEKPAFRRAFASRRCLLPADGYFEWYPTEAIDPRGKPVKQPFFITPRDGEVLAMAGLYEIWRNPKVSDDDEPNAFVWSATVITTAAEDSLGHIHDRMPMLVEHDRYDDWLDPRRTATDELHQLLVPAAPGRLTAYPVSTAVNYVRNNGPELVSPLPVEGGVPPGVKGAVPTEAEGTPEALFNV